MGPVQSTFRLENRGGGAWSRSHGRNGTWVSARRKAWKTRSRHAQSNELGPAVHHQLPPRAHDFLHDPDPAPVVGLADGEEEGAVYGSPQPLTVIDLVVVVVRKPGPALEEGLRAGDHARGPGVQCIEPRVFVEAVIPQPDRHLRSKGVDLLHQVHLVVPLARIHLVDADGIDPEQSVRVVHVMQEAIEILSDE